MNSMSHIAKVGKFILTRLLEAQPVIQPEAESEIDPWIPRRILARLSKHQIKLFLLYHFYPEISSRNGLIKNVSEKEVADLLGCTVKTVRNSNLQLVKHNYIIYSKADTGNFSLILKDYPNYHVKANKGGAGYINITKELMESLMAVDDVNVLRMQLRSLLEHDNENIGRLKAQSVSIEFRTFKKNMPKYMNSKRSIIEKLEKNPGLFDYRFSGDYVKVELGEEYIGKYARKDLTVKFLDRMFKVVKGVGMDWIPESSQGDIAQMCIQYGEEITLSSLKNVLEKYLQENGSITNLGGLVRTVIRKKLQYVA